MQCAKNSVTVEEVTEDGMPYKLLSADRYACPECGTSVIVGFGEPLAEHWQPEYATIRLLRIGRPGDEFITGRHALEGGTRL